MALERDIVVIGGGHAGAEAAWAAARLGVPTLLVTMVRAAIGRMSCNPAIGGIAKGQMVREIDALGGLMGLAADAAGIQFRILNRSKGPAVQAPRAQCDRRLYASAVQERLASTPNLSVIEGCVVGFDVARSPGGRGPIVRAVRLGDGRVLRCRCVVLTTGTFLRAVIHTGDCRAEAGRVGERAAVALGSALADLGFELGRLKTGTPPRVARDSVDFDRLEEQPGDENPRPFSFMNDRITLPQVSCWITHTNSGTHDLIRANLHRSPMYSGRITSPGPRYCPSIEDKVVRFADKPRHQLFLEPEGYESDRIYCNGISTSLPADVQEQMVRSIEGLERAVIVQVGYAVEYDYVPPQQTRPTLESKKLGGLFLAGQTNGTSGYEEAAGQGIIAGINAARLVLEAEPLVLGRDESYIGVMIDDLVTRGTVEPYRMFTSRAEYRLLLRSDNADARLTPIGRRLGLVDEARWRRFSRKQAAAKAFADWADRCRHDGRPLAHWLRRPQSDDCADIDWHAWKKALPSSLTGCGDVLLDEAMAAVTTTARYDGYIRRQEREIERFRRFETRRIPDDFDFSALGQLRQEARDKFSAVGPRSVGQARRIAGISPADIAVVLLHLEARRRGSARRKG